MKNGLWLAGLLALFVTTDAMAVVRNVPADHATISAAIAASVNGDEVVVAPGTYVEVIDFGGKAITVRSSDGPGVTTIQGPGGVPVVRFDSGESALAVLEGFTVTGGLGTDLCGIVGCETNGGGVHVIASSPTITGNIISGNSTVGVGVVAGQGTGGGMYVQDGSPTVTFNLFVGNSADGTGGGLTAVNSSMFLVNNTFSDNAAPLGACMWADGGAPTVVNNIFWGNTGVPIGSPGPIGGIFEYNLVQGGIPFPAPGVIDVDPLFVDPDGGDYHLAAGSPAIDAGSPGSPLEPDGTIVDLGAYSTALDVPIFVRGDCNADGSNNIADAIFALGVLFPPPGGPGPQASCSDACDGNDDGNLNIADAIAILDSLFGPGVPLPEPSAGCGEDPTSDALDCPEFGGCL